VKLDALAIAEVLTHHYPTRGMQVSMGATCHCGYWTGSEPDAGKRPLPWGVDRLDLHRGRVIEALIAGNGGAHA